MIRNTLVFAALAANAAAGPCKPSRSSTELLSTTIGSTETSYFETSITELASATSSVAATETTDTVSTTTAAESAGEDYYFQILPQLRRLAKRDTKTDTIHYVGPNNPSDCSSATIYHLASGQLLDSEVPFYYTSGQEYQEFGTQGEPPADAVKTTFSIARGALRWANDAFGGAAFCQDQSNGKVYIIFSSAPSNCQRVTLVAYKPEECQPAVSSTVVSESIEASTDVESATTTAPATDAAEAATSSDATGSTDVSIASSDATTTAEATTTLGSESTTTAADVCVQSLTAQNGEPPLASRESDCHDFNRVTVSSYEVTQTVYKRGNVIIIPTNAIVRRADGDAATTILPTGTPAYATYCDGPAAYYAACSELGVTAFTTTIPEPTSTEIIITN
ncbi:hypothetical protein NW762_010561 [Fusarium torreyae]|uniref:DUF7908 domain-containing protein n=1 Tax=Fusarium torreyae TaxID=1237075 RepID=A0A9W8VAA2_9HYPO|nr:hypothetical protein NW762_010561 [Fusarium torreyae]